MKFKKNPVIIMPPRLKTLFLFCLCHKVFQSETITLLITFEVLAVKFHIVHEFPTHKTFLWVPTFFTM